MVLGNFQCRGVPPNFVLIVGKGPTAFCWQNVQDMFSPSHIPGKRVTLSDTLLIQAAPSSITFFRGDLVMKCFLRTFHDQVSTKECVGRGDRTRARLHAKRTRLRSSYRTWLLNEWRRRFSE